MQVFDTYNKQIAAAQKAGVNPTITMPAADAVAADLAELGVLTMAADGTYQKSATKLNAAQKKNLEQYMNHLMMMQKDVCCDAVEFKDGGYKVNSGRRKVYQNALVNTLTQANDLNDQMLVGTRGVWLHNKNTTAEPTFRVIAENEIAATPAMVSPKAKVKGKSIFAKIAEGASAFLQSNMRPSKAFGLGLLFVAGSVFAKVGGKDTRGDLARHDEHRTEAAGAPDNTKVAAVKEDISSYKAFTGDTVSKKQEFAYNSPKDSFVTAETFTIVNDGDTAITRVEMMPLDLPVTQTFVTQAAPETKTVSSGIRGVTRKAKAAQTAFNDTAASIAKVQTAAPDQEPVVQAVPVKANPEFEQFSIVIDVPATSVALQKDGPSDPVRNAPEGTIRKETTHDNGFKQFEYTYKGGTKVSGNNLSFASDVPVTKDDFRNNGTEIAGTNNHYTKTTTVGAQAKYVYK